MSFSSESCLLHFWSPFPGHKAQEFLPDPRTRQKTDDVFTVAISQSGFIEDPKELEATGFFEDLAFLDDLENKEPDAVVNASKANHKQIIANSCKNGQNSNHSTKEISPDRSKRIAKRDLNVESSSSSIKISSSKKQKRSLPFKLQVAVGKNAFYNLSYGP